MQRKVVYMLLGCLIFVSAGFFEYLILKNANRFRLDTAQRLYAESQSNDEYSLLKLVESDALQGTSDKKIQIATAYLESERPEIAEAYLRRTDNQMGNILMSEYYLLKGSPKANRYLELIGDADTKDELIEFRKTSTGNYSPNISNPRTDLGYLLKAMNTGDYSLIEKKPLLSTLANSLGRELNPNNQAIIASSYYSQNGLPWLSLNILNNLQSNAGVVPQLSLIVAQNYAELRDYGKATEAIDEAIRVAPEDMSLYQIGVEYATAAGNSTRAEYWTARLNYLKSISK